MLFKGLQARRYTRNTVHTQGGTQRRRFVANEGVMFFKGPQARRYTQNAVRAQGSAYTMRNARNAVFATVGVMLLKGP